jgi:hypothetical protein
MGPPPGMGRTSRKETLVSRLSLFGWTADRWSEYYLRKIDECKALATAERESGGNLSRSLVRLKVERLKWTLPIILGTLVIVAFGIALNLLLKGRVADIVLLIALVAAWFIEFLALAVLAERRREYRLVYAFYHLIQYIELNGRQWPDFGFRGRINQKIEEAARAIERMPDVFQLDSANAAKFTQLAQRKAFALRELKIWVTQPTPLTFNDLLRRLGTDLVTVVNRRWHELPDPESREAEAKAADGRNLSRSRRILLVSLAIVASVAAAAVVSVQDRFGSAATIVSSVLGTVALGLFASTGVSVDGVKQLVETSTLIYRPPK